MMLHSLLARLGWLQKWLPGQIRTKIIIPMSLSAVATAMAVLVSSAAVSFDFADKGQGIDKYVKHISGLIADGNPGDACQYTQQLEDAYDEHLVNMEKEAKSNNKQSDHRLVGARSTRQSLELLRGNVLLTAQSISPSDWLARYERKLNAHPDSAGVIVRTLAGFPENVFTAQMVDTLLGGDIPQTARVQLEQCAFRRKFLRNKNTDVIWGEFHEEIAVQKSDVETKKELLGQYVLALDSRGERDNVDRALDNIVKLSPDTALGAEAARLRLAGVSEGPTRDKLVIDLVGSHRNSAIANALKDNYTIALASQGRVKEALRRIDNQQLLDTANSQDRQVEVLRELVPRLCEIRPEPIGNRGNRAAAKKDTSGPALKPSAMYAGLAEELLNAERYDVSMAMSYEALRIEKALPINLTTGMPISNASDIVDITDPGVSPKVAQYLAAKAQYATGSNESAEKMLQGLLDESTPASIRSHALFLKAFMAASAGDAKTSLDWARKTEEITPDSPVVQTFITIQKDLARPSQK